MKNTILNPYRQVTFLKSAARIQQLPNEEGFEVAFAGRSNAGKSSALNCLTGIKQLARVSKTPGRTQLINVFVLGDHSKRLVDLPGYGYAKVAKKTKEDWQENLADYLERRESLRGLILLMDIRHPLKDLDQMMIHWAINRQLPVHILLTKSDKLSRGQAQSTLIQVRKQFDLLPDLISVQTFSSLKKDGLDELILLMNRWLEIA